ncbi:MAG: MBL fold metallo-hydrolase [Candidatus Thermoplasmatota archaeon]|jgi:phosphoribosyl 1,2-cyclic phosphodiesterase|nr:MBL fold metallo-hydrolase [Candidatus Thermoplasmatota archaeon]
MLITSLGSGSTGNSTLICSDDTCILIDLGLSYRKVETALNTKGFKVGQINAVFITHGHSDHASGVHTFRNRTKIPVFGTYETSDIYVEQRGGYGGYQEMGVEIVNFIKEGTPEQVGDLTIEAIRVSHDARHPVAYTVQNGNKKVAVVTDLGEGNALLRRRLKECNLVVIEANHDPLLLENGPYPETLKRRIRNPRGHLSNEQTGNILKSVMDSDTIPILAHLSQVNNTPQIAIQTVHDVLREGGFKSNNLKALLPYNDPSEYRI